MELTRAGDSLSLSRTESGQPALPADPHRRGILFAQRPSHALPHLSETTSLQRFWRDRSWMQDHHRITTQTVRYVLALRGANAILALIANRLSGRFEQYWQNRFR